MLSHHRSGVLQNTPQQGRQCRHQCKDCLQHQQTHARAHACRPLHHNARALRNVSYMVDDAELPDILANLPPCDGASDEGECIWRASPGSALTSHKDPRASAWDCGLKRESARDRACHSQRRLHSISHMLAGFQAQNLPCRGMWLARRA